ncbi:MAG: hypothetical protein IKI77_03390 [Oscillospiraceae bacterium]|nr:hypothetical protein [Oscillospiraceae bacterium]
MTGDLNDDGKVGAEDAQLALIAYTKRFAGVETGLSEQQFRAADVNGDHKLSADDAQFILIYYTTNQVAGKGITWAELLGGMPQPRPALRR